MEWAVKQIHNISRPGQPAAKGDTVEVECVGGFVKRVDPVTRTTKDTHQRFVIADDAGTLRVKH